MRLVALVESREHVCARYRLAAFEEPFRQAGHSLELQSLPSTWWNRLNVGSSLRDADAVILQRKLLSRTEIVLLRRRVRRLWFDFDDALWSRDSYSQKGFASRKRAKRFQSVVRVVDVVIAGNRYLAEHATTLGARAAWVIPTCVDATKYPVAEHRGDRADLVWIGSSSTLKGLEGFHSVLEKIGSIVPSVRLKLICDRFIQVKSMPIVECRWSESTEAAEIAAADIGISWIPDDPWSRGKCGLKLLQYMAAGLPVVTNPVGVHSEIVEQGKTGFLATSETEWIEAIATLARDADLRQRMGAAGRQAVIDRYSVEAGTAMWLNLIDGLSAGRATA